MISERKLNAEEKGDSFVRYPRSTVSANVHFLPPEVASLKDKIDYLEQKVSKIEGKKTNKRSSSTQLTYIYIYIYIDIGQREELSNSFQKDKFRPISVKKKKSTKGIGSRASPENGSFWIEEERFKKQEPEKKKRSKSRSRKKGREIIINKFTHHNSTTGTQKFSN